MLPQCVVVLTGGFLSEQTGIIYVYVRYCNFTLNHSLLSLKDKVDRTYTLCMSGEFSGSSMCKTMATFSAGLYMRNKRFYIQAKLLSPTNSFLNFKVLHEINSTSIYNFCQAFNNLIPVLDLTDMEF